MAILASASSIVFNTASAYVFKKSPPVSVPSTSNNLPNESTSTLAATKKSRRNSAFLPSANSTQNALDLDLNEVNPALNGFINEKQRLEKKEGEDLCKKINSEEDLYNILGVQKKVKVEEIRRAFLARSRICHPDKLPHYLPATPAFQRLSFAYETLSKPSSRRMYDLGGGRGYDAGTARQASAAGLGDETLHGVLRSVFTEFLAGDFEMIRVFFNALNDGNPGLNLGDEAVDNLEGAFQRIRQILLTGQKYLNLLKFELIRLYEIQHSLRSLSYLDLVGRLRLTLALTRVTLEIPLVLDRAMRSEEVSRPRGKRRKKRGRNSENGKGKGKARTSNGIDSTEEEGISAEEIDEEEDETETDDDDDDDEEEEAGTPSTGSSSTEGSHANSIPNTSAFTSESGGGELQSRGLLGPRVKGVLVLACKVLEKGERFGI